MRHAVVTGTSGYVAAGLSQKLRERYAMNVIGVDKRSGPKTDVLANVAEWEPDVRPNIVFHLAANADIAELEREPELAHENFMATKNVVSWNPDRIVFASTSAVYGDVSSQYERSKKRCEGLMREQDVTLRLFNVAGHTTDGSWDQHESGHLWPALHWAEDTQEPFTLYGAGNEIRQWVDIIGVHEAFLIAMTIDVEAMRGRIIDVTNPWNEASVIEVVRLWQVLRGVEVKMERHPQLRPGTPHELASYPGWLLKKGWNPGASLLTLIKEGAW